MKTAKLTEQYDYKYRSWNKVSYEKEKFGFNGTYTNKDLGECHYHVTQDDRYNYYLLLDVWERGYEYSRNFKCSCLPSKRLVCNKARDFLKEVKKCQSSLQ